MGVIMSERIVCETKYSCIETLKEALNDLGIPLEAVEFHEEAQIMSIPERLGEHRANIILRGVTAGTDIGFLKQADGKYEAIVPTRAWTVGSRILSKINGGTGELDQLYAKRAVLKAISKTYGHTLKTCENQNGKIQIRVSVR